MAQPEFDEFSQNYETLLEDSIAIGGEESSYYLRYKIGDVAKHYPPDQQSSAGSLEILDFGAGTGNAIPFWHEFLPSGRLTCLDVSSQSLKVAAKRHPDLANFIAYTPPTLPIDDDRFDLAYAACVFHHIAPEDRIVVLKELWRILKPGGQLFIYEHNPHNPLTQRVVRSCPFDKNAKLIRAKDLSLLLNSLGFQQTTIRYRVFFPRCLRILRPFEELLTWLPLGAQYYTTSVKATSDNSG
ncbi:MAG: class I SAM-dependent methyltransferase [Pirellulaceae bacterium]|nr:class I SAM-dependent methyltransferase [Planctomycetaceae bacterium]MDG2385122.1 class I SAM-dependent methyltransferase [Pirellulaceae bacterium]